MTVRAAVERWMQAYMVAWDSNEPEDIRSLFTPDAEYLFHPWDDPVVGHDDIVTEWLDNRDEPDDHTFTWHIVAIDGSTAIVQGETLYQGGDAYENLWIIRFADDDRAESFTEWYMEPPTD